MSAVGLTVTIPTSSNWYTMKTTNPYITTYGIMVNLVELKDIVPLKDIQRNK